MLNTLHVGAGLREPGRLAYGEWMIDGAPLRAWVDAAVGVPAVWDVVGLPTDTAVAALMVAVLLRRAPAELESGRSVLYRCPQCLDVGCGAFAVRVEREGDKILWHDFAWEGRADAVPPYGDKRFSRLPVLRFAPRQYYEALTDLPDALRNAEGPATG